MKIRRDYLFNTLNVFTFFGFVLAQPLFDLLSRNARFFIARHSEPLDIILFAVLVCFLCPALVVLLGEILGLLQQRIRHFYYFLVAAILAAGFALLIFNKLTGISGTVTVVAASIFAVIFALMYIRFRPFRANLVFLSPAILVFPIWFLANSSIYEIIFPGEPAASMEVSVKKPAPIFFVVFDEFPVTSLLDEERAIDPARYPNFAALAKNSYWFRNATTISSDTLLSIPSILSGRYPKPEQYFPTSSHHPNQLFTLLGGSYEIKSFEVLTELCPEALCSDTKEQNRLFDRMQSLLSDISIVYLHILFPSEFSSRLPDITSSWMHFGKEIPKPPGPASESRFARPDWNSKWDRIDWNDRTEVFHRFIDSIGRDDHQTLFFLHVLFPHSAWSYLPSGKMHTLSKDMDIRGAVGKNSKGLDELLWTDNLWAITQMLQRHLLQVGFVDKLLGDLIAHLKSLDLYDRSLIVITADHGISFQPEMNRREATDTNYYDIMAVPLLIKAPHQEQGVISDRNIETIDILPTIADMLEIDLPWPVDGQSALDLSQPERKQRIIYNSSSEMHAYGPIMDEKYQTLDRIIDLFGAGSRDSLFGIGAYSGLIGKEVLEGEIKQEKGLEVLLQYSDLYSNLKPDASFIPANVMGRILANQKYKQPLNLAVAVNGTIRAVTETYMESGEIKFAALVPEKSFRQGANEVTIYLARGPDISDLSRL